KISALLMSGVLLRLNVSHNATQVNGNPEGAGMGGKQGGSGLEFCAWNSEKWGPLEPRMQPATHSVERVQCSGKKPRTVGTHPTSWLLTRAPGCLPRDEHRGKHYRRADPK